jgi:hypothetical protein
MRQRKGKHGGGSFPFMPIVPAASRSGTIECLKLTVKVGNGRCAGVTMNTAQVRAHLRAVKMGDGSDSFSDSIAARLATFFEPSMSEPSTSDFSIVEDPDVELNGEEPMNQTEASHFFS